MFKLEKQTFDLAKEMDEEQGPAAKAHCLFAVIFGSKP